MYYVLWAGVAHLASGREPYPYYKHMSGNFGDKCGCQSDNASHTGVQLYTGLVHTIAANVQHIRLISAPGSMCLMWFVSEALSTSIRDRHLLWGLTQGLP